MLAPGTFRNPFNNDHKEITDYAVTLLDANLIAFDVYLKWFYGEHFYSLAQDNLTAPDEKASGDSDAYWTK
jgi:hypothetical protein